ncbi:MAG: hypothetical protein KBD06_02905 [Candidatus Pacebacteria bacterium]|nr:hypothetical protein [Candidatus Paceibacterota bacterium]
MKGPVTFLALVLLGCALIFIYSVNEEPTLSPGLRPEISQDEIRQDEAYKNRLMDLPTYMNVHISELSPVQETLGGKFYVTDVTASGGVGVVRYDDGHMQYVADFTYKGSDAKGYTITKFKIRER